jgi:hypothetical protein
MALWNRFEERLARRRAADEDAKLKLARNALARAFDDEAERLNGGKMIEYGSSRAEVSEATKEAKDLASYVRKLPLHDPRIEEALQLKEAESLTPFPDKVREVLAEPWPGGFDPEAKLAAATQALRESRADKEASAERG